MGAPMVEVSDRLKDQQHADLLWLAEAFKNTVLGQQVEHEIARRENNNKYVPITIQDASANVQRLISEVK